MITEDQKSLLEAYNNAMALYKERKWKEAKDGFLKCLSIIKDDGPSQLYVTRCEEYLLNPPGDDWDGVFVMKTK